MGLSRTSFLEWNTKRLNDLTSKSCIQQIAEILISIRVTHCPGLPGVKGFWGYVTSSAKIIKPLGKLGCVCHLNFNLSVTDSNAHVFEHKTKTSPQGDWSLKRQTNIWEDTYHIQRKGLLEWEELEAQPSTIRQLPSRLLSKSTSILFRKFFY